MFGALLKNIGLGLKDGSFVYLLNIVVWILFYVLSFLGQLFFITLFTAALFLKRKGVKRIKALFILLMHQARELNQQQLSFLSS